MQVYITAIEEGFLYGLLALGIYISLRILDIPDLTAEGSGGFAGDAGGRSPHGLVDLNEFGADKVVGRDVERLQFVDLLDG